MGSRAHAECLATVWHEKPHSQPSFPDPEWCRPSGAAGGSSVSTIIASFLSPSGPWQPCCAPRLGTGLEGSGWRLALVGKQDTQNSQEHIQFPLIKP